MSNIPEKYKKWHKLCFENKTLLQNAKRCACFYCGGRFDVSEIESWIEDNNGLTAQCPKCDIDSVIPAVIDGKEVTNEELKIMGEYWF